jgi:hypothetical protein
MAKKAAVKPKTPGYDLDAGVGVQWATNDYGWGLEEMPHMAVLMHPLQGITLWGPFVNEDAAHAWVRKEGDGAAMHYYGETGVSRWCVAGIHVPTHPKAEGRSDVKD